MPGVRDFLRSTGLPPDDLHELPDSAKRFPDGAQYRVEIPSTEGPRCLEAVLERASELDVRVHRVSQGSGVFMQTDAELDEMARARGGREGRGLVVRPAGRGVGAVRDRAGACGLCRRRPRAGAARREPRGLRRAAEHGFRSVLIADVGVLAAFGEARDAGLLPPDMQAKISVMLPAANAAAARVFERLGASTINLPTDLTLAQIAAIRAVVDVPLDVYVEAPDNVGGFLRHHEIPELIRVAAPVYVKFGLRNAPDVYPAGTHSKRRRSPFPRAGPPRAPRARAARTLGLRAVDLRARRRRPRCPAQGRAGPVSGRPHGDEADVSRS